MKNKSTLLFLILAFSAFNLRAQQVTWIKNYAVYSSSKAYDVIELNNSYYSIAYNSGGGTTNQFKLLRLNYQGDTIFTKNINTLNWIVPRRMTPTNDGGMVVTGVESCNAVLIKIDSIGNVIWDKNFEDIITTDCDDMFGVSNVHDGGFIATGFNQNPNSIKVMRFDANGDSLWKRLFPISASDEGNYVEQTRDSNFLVSASINSGPSSGQSYLIKLNQAGDTIWTKTIGVVALNNFQNFCMTHELNDSSLTMLINKENKFTLRHMNQYGDSLWQYYDLSFGRQVPRSMELTSDGGYIMTGDSLYPFPTYNYSAIKIVKADASGNAMWKQNLTFNSTSSFHRGYKVIETSDHGYLVTGTWHDGYDQTVFIKLDSLGNIPTALNEPLPFGSVMVYPNPLTNRLNIDFHTNELSEIILYDIASRKILEKKFMNSISLNTELLEKGIYLYEVRDKNGSCKKGKVVKD